MKKIIIMLAAIISMVATELKAQEQDAIKKAFEYLAKSPQDQATVKALLDKWKNKDVVAEAALKATRDTLVAEYSMNTNAVQRIQYLKDSISKLLKQPKQVVSSVPPKVQVVSCDSCLATIKRMQKAYEILYAKNELAHSEVEHVSDPKVKRTVHVLWEGPKSEIPKPGDKVTGTVSSNEAKKVVKK